jgi:hypothetical protein
VVSKEGLSSIELVSCLMFHRHRRRVLILRKATFTLRENHYRVNITAPLDAATATATLLLGLLTMSLLVIVILIVCF